MTIRPQHPKKTGLRWLALAIFFSSLSLAGPLWAQTFTVNSTGDGADAAIDGQCDTGNLIGGLPECTLRAALQEANQSGPAVVDIHFDIAGCPGDSCVIQIDTLAGLPLITAPVNIDGSTQPGNAEVCQVDIVDRSAYRVALQGTGAGDAHGLHLVSGSDGSVIRGLNIRHFGRGIMLVGSSGNRIECNAIGTDGTGLLPGPGNQVAGIFLACDSADNVIGGAMPEQANLIGANGEDGVQIFGGYTSCGGDQPEDNMPVNNAVLGNQIGIAADGTSPLGNLLAGIAIFGGPGADHNLIGVLQDRATIRGNVIGFNGTSGLYINSDGKQPKPTEDTLVQGNYFGTDRSGLLNLGNEIGGIDIIRGALTQIGGTAAGAANVFAFNGDGIYMTRLVSDRNRIQRNSMYANNNRGIILEGGHEFDPPGTGPNQLQAAPAIIGAYKENDLILVTYAVPDQVENFPLVIEFFLADGDREQGRVFLVEQDYPAAGNRNLTFSAGPVDVGQFLVATATDSLGNSSEFSAVSQVLGEVPIEQDQIFQDRFQ